MERNSKTNGRRIAPAIIAALSLVLAGTGLNIATADEPCDPAWHPFTAGGQIGVNSTVRALTVWNSSPVVGGLFTTAGGQTVNSIAAWVTPLPSGPADLNCDGDANVGVEDLLILLANWG